MVSSSPIISLIKHPSDRNSSIKRSFSSALAVLFKTRIISHLLFNDLRQIKNPEVFPRGLCFFHPGGTFHPPGLFYDRLERAGADGSKEPKKAAKLPGLNFFHAILFLNSIVPKYKSLYFIEVINQCQRIFSSV